MIFSIFDQVYLFIYLYRFDEMVDHMKAVAQQPQELTVEERNLLSVAYKNVIGSRRASWRVISSIEQKGDADKLSLIQSYKRKIETELEDICSDILEIIKNELIPNSESEEGKVFYYKMKGDYHRFVSIFHWELCCEYRLLGVLMRVAFSVQSLLLNVL